MAGVAGRGTMNTVPQTRSIGAYIIVNPGQQLKIAHPQPGTFSTALHLELTLSPVPNCNCRMHRLQVLAVALLLLSLHAAHGGLQLAWPAPMCSKS